MKTVLKDDTVTAFTECQSFDNHIKQKEKVLDVFVGESVAKHPAHEQYFKSMLHINDLKAANTELGMLNDAIKCLKMKMELMTEDVKENGNLLEVLKRAL